MFDSRNPSSVLEWADADLAELPTAEDESHEYKNSKSTDKELAEKLARAASGFWNAGGGIFVAGVDGHGKADGGLTTSVGRQSRRDWADQAIGAVVPNGPYSITLIADSGAGLSIGPDNSVLVAAFGESFAGPHMAPDGRYYVRAGAHTVRASHFLVEAIRARRAVNDPQLAIILRVDPDNSYRTQIGVVALTEAPALDVEMSFSSLPPILARVKPPISRFRRAVVDRMNPFYLGYTVFAHNEKKWLAADREITVQISFRDILGRAHSVERTLDGISELGPPPLDTSPLERIALSLNQIDIRLDHLVKAKARAT
jgi:hypothetical protein